MKIRHQEIKIEKGKPFANCKLDRGKYAEVLTQIVETYAEGMVLAVDNPWGTGKTTFVRMWKQYLEDREFRTVYFNAWENDFDSNALVAILAELKPLTREGNKEVFKSVVQKGAVLAKNILPALIKALAARHFDTKELQDALGDATKGVTEIFETEIDEYANRKKTIEDFRETLEKFIDVEKGEKPLVFFVDELDRCRPSYAVEVLEQLKHLFTVPGIVFVLSIDKEQLANSVRGVYGSDRINAEEYLRRFIDLEYSMPRPSTSQFCSYLFHYFSLSDVLESDKRRSLPDLQNDAGELLGIAGSLFDIFKASLRQQEKVFGLVRLGLQSFRETESTYPNVFLFLVVVKIMLPEFYSQIRSGTIEIELLEAEISKITSQRSFMEVGVHMGMFHALILRSYYLQHYDLNKAWEIQGHSIIRGEIQSSGVFSKFPAVYKAWQILDNDQESSKLKIGYLLNKIDLLEPLNLQ